MGYFNTIFFFIHLFSLSAHSSLNYTLSRKYPSSLIPIRSIGLNIYKEISIFIASKINLTLKNRRKTPQIKNSPCWSFLPKNENRTNGGHPDQKIRIGQSKYNSSHQRRM